MDQRGDDKAGRKKNGNGFLAFGIDQNINKGLIKMGYRQPTPIQRKVIPPLLAGRDCVAMARTGSGKTAAFLIPAFQRLRTRSSKVRAVIISPTRELAMQTAKFAKQIGRFSDLKIGCVLGGASMDSQFESLLLNRPDIVVVTPGRFVHVAIEMDLKLDSVELLIMDEADRLFEMGCADELREIIARLPSGGQRQTVLVSATLPKLLVDFIKAPVGGHQHGLMTDPLLVRLDVECQLPPTLELCHLHLITPEQKIATLLYLLNQLKKCKTVIFCATRHHVDYLHLILDESAIDHTYVYSKLDSTARSDHLRVFKFGSTPILLVTDLAARGLDMPLLDVVINFNFPAKPKLFVHRVGRVARNGKKGQAYSLIAGDELAYFCDLQRYIGTDKSSYIATKSNGDDKQNKLGKVPQFVFDNFSDQVQSLHSKSDEISSMKKVADNGQRQYLKSRPAASTESVREAGKIYRLSINAGAINSSSSMTYHPMFESVSSDSSSDREAWLAGMKTFRPSATVFELGSKLMNKQMRCSDKTRTLSSDTCESSKHNMVAKRKLHDVKIARFSDALKQRALASVQPNSTKSTSGASANLRPEVTDESDLRAIFDISTVSSCRKSGKRTANERDGENYISYQPPDEHTESGLSISGQTVRGQCFESSIKNAVVDFISDEHVDISREQRAKKLRPKTATWDTKKKKYIVKNDAPKKIKTESGIWISASFKTDKFSKWQDRSKVSAALEQDGGNSTDLCGDRSQRRQRVALPPPAKKGGRVPRNELKRPEQILKTRKVQAKQQYRNKRKSTRKKKC